MVASSCLMNHFFTFFYRCHEPISKLRHGNVQANSFGPSHEPGFIHRTAGWQESSTPPVGMYNGMVVSTEIVSCILQSN